MRSITLKIILVLVVVSLAGALFTAFFIQFRTQKAFNNFLLDENQLVFTEVLTDYYQTNLSWDGVEVYFKGPNQPQMGMGMQGGTRDNIPRMMFRGPNPFILADSSGEIIAGGIGHPGYLVGDKISSKDLRNGFELKEDDQTIGWLVVAPLSQPKTNTQLDFLKNIQRGLIISSIITLLIALILGGILIQSFTRPIRKLANATEVVAGGELGYQVEIDSQDELGRLANSFNQMSIDLESADQARKQMTADIAHDLRTPLSLLHGYTEAMSEGKLNGTKEIFQVMHEQAQHLNYLIEDLRTLTLLDSNELQLNIQDIDPSLVINSIKAAFLSLAEEKGVNLTTEVASELPRVDLDPDRLNQILGNLLNNALKIIHTGGTIQIKSRQVDDIIMIDVIDNGPGIKEDDLPHIFERFYRTDESRGSDGSSGLGLAITKKLVEAMGGEIRVTSEINKSTTFSLSFPV
jgi:signal transduction histidine kinase